MKTWGVRAMIRTKRGTPLIRFFRNLLITLIIFVGIPAGLWGYSRYVEPSLLVTKKIAVTAPATVSPCKVVFFTDTHFGNLYPEENLQKIVAKINAQNPDLVVFGGDFIDNYNQDAAYLDILLLEEELSNIKATYGKYAVWGNHDYGGGAEWIYPDIMAAGGFTLLTNEGAYIPELGMNILGYDDYLLGHTDPQAYTIDHEDFTLVLTHEPDVTDQLNLSNAGLILAGHSHGGQVSLPVITKYMLPSGATEYTKGLYDAATLGKSEGTQLFVSKGIGLTMIPYRFLNPPEIVVVNINQ